MSGDTGAELGQDSRSLSHQAVQAWQNTETGEISETYALDGSGIVFNLEGLPFKLPAFVLGLRRRNKLVLAAWLQIPALDPINLLQIGELIPLGVAAREIRAARSAELILALKPEWVEACLAPAYAGLQHLYQLLQLRDATGGHLLLDFYNYQLQDLQLLE